MKIHVKSFVPNSQHYTDCAICGEKLLYTKTVERECAICHKNKLSNAICAAGHFVCDECHSAATDDIRVLLINSTEKDPIKLFDQLVSRPDVHMHGPEHHVFVPCALITAYQKSGGDIDLVKALDEALKRAKQVPGGACGYWGACGAAISAGIYISVVTGDNPMNREWWAMSQELASRCLHKNAEAGGVRCCKRTSYTAILEAVNFTREKLGLNIPVADFNCTRSTKNSECLGTRCPYFNKK